MKVRRGETVLVDYPYSDRSGSKVRPCLVVQTDRNNARLDDTIVVTITSRRRTTTSEPTQLVIDPSTPAGRQSGLLFSSTIQCENLLTVDTGFIMRKIGELPTDMMIQVNECLKAAVGIP